ncbi:MAG: nuclear transport factor 2 family protein [Gemmatimonadota bacterium]|jgi:hypothetical protein|nr:MAG: nuclear transport factor 2 family protein [Gemmatimonadota bacterium]
MLRRFSLAVIALALACASPAQAQQWTAEQQEVLDFITGCWDAWVGALADETPDAFYETCRQDEDVLFWWTEDGAPNGKSAVYRNWKYWRKVDVDWADMRPIAVNIFGDVAIVYLYGYWIANTPDGPVTTEAKRTEVFQRRDQGWTFIGAQATPATPADAEPYQ